MNKTVTRPRQYGRRPLAYDRHGDIAEWIADDVGGSETARPSSFDQLGDRRQLAISWGGR